MNDIIGCEDRFAIEELAARYNLAIDLGDPAGWVACFTPDGEFAIDAVGSWTESVHGIKVSAFRGEAALLAFAQRVANGPPVRHWSGNRVLTAMTDGVEAVSYMNVLYLDATPEESLLTGVMRDRLFRQDDGWRFASRRIAFDR